CGARSGWRVPTVHELLSIVHRGTSDPSIDTNYFPNTMSSYYWSSDIYAPNPAVAWYVVFGNGYTYAYFQSYDFHVRLVRSGQ
ncbi:DUF1566 domain-containing protein, partial [bacterium]|nr:DUF1566 domain-containing protein [bacterium]